MGGILKPTLILMSGRILGYAACFIIPLVLVRVFDQEIFGTYKQLFLIYGTLYAVAQFGLSESLFYFIPEKSRRAGHYVCNAVIILIVVGALCAGLLWVLQSYVAELLNNKNLIGTLPFIAIYTFFMLVASVLEVSMTARKRHVLASLTYAVSDSARALVCILPALIFQDLHWLLIWTVVLAAARLVATLYYMKLEFAQGFRPKPRLATRQLVYAGPFGIAILVDIVQSQLHLYFVSYHFDAATFAIYAIACLHIPIVDYLSISAGNVLMVRMRELKGVGLNEMRKLWNDTISKLALILFPLVGALLLTANEFILVLFTPEYQAAVPVFMIWVVSFLFSVLPTDAILRSHAQNRFLLTINLTSLVLVVVLITPFMQMFSLQGPVIVTLIAIVVGKMMGLARARSLLNASLHDILPWRSLIRTLFIAALAAVPVAAMKETLALPALLLLMVTGGAYVLVYYALILRLGELDDEERRVLTGWIRYPIGNLVRTLKG
jgi:O-antigen/teichoic acid export membrane protein